MRDEGSPCMNRGAARWPEAVQGHSPAPKHPTWGNVGGGPRIWFAGEKVGDVAEKEDE